ncbi:MAG: CYTH domain-containing protein [Christiangramia sp.]|uniref:CYTH domain-containing protein n=1 Tax=Christiangramia sp. TaxID=1931228 RepID=UPI0032421AC6
MIETERKFLVTSEDFKKQATEQKVFRQAYLNTDPQRTVRVRLTGDTGYLTIKGKSSNSGMSRYEWEKAIPVAEAEELLKICEPGMIEKTRFLVPVAGHTFEVDEFFGAHTGLIIAEIELNTEDEDFERPEWLGKEVTGDLRYYNSQLIKKPIKNQQDE